MEDVSEGHPRKEIVREVDADICWRWCPFNAAHVDIGHFHIGPDLKVSTIQIAGRTYMIDIDFKLGIQNIRQAIFLGNHVFKNDRCC